MLGVAVGGRADDYEPFGVPMEDRGKRFEEMLEEIKRLWAGDERGFAGGVGPDVSDNPPQLIIGGQVDAAFRRAARVGDGWMMGGGPPEHVPGRGREARGGLARAGSRGQPTQAVADLLLAGRRSRGRHARASIGDYYAFADEYRDMVVAGTAKGPDEIRERVRGVRGGGLRRADHVPGVDRPRAGRRAGTDRALSALPSTGARQHEPDDATVQAANRGRPRRTLALRALAPAAPSRARAARRRWPRTPRRRRSPCAARRHRSAPAPRRTCALRTSRSPPRSSETAEADPEIAAEEVDALREDLRRELERLASADIKASRTVRGPTTPPG